MCKNDGIQDLVLPSVRGLRLLLSAATSLFFVVEIYGGFLNVGFQ